MSSQQLALQKLSSYKKTNRYWKGEQWLSDRCQSILMAIRLWSLRHSLDPKQNYHSVLLHSEM